MKTFLLALNRGLEAIALPILGLCLILATLILATLPVAAAPLASTDGNANYGCQWVKAENGNYLVLANDCKGVPVITGGVGYTTETKTVDLGYDTATVTERVGRERGTEVSRDVVDVSFSK